MAASLLGQAPRDAAPERSPFDLPASHCEDSKPPPARDVTSKLEAPGDAQSHQFQADSEGAFLVSSGMVAVTSWDNA